MDGEITNLLRPHQVADAREELASLNAMLQAPPHIKGMITDRGMMQKRAKRLTNEIDTATPRAYAPNERDAVVREFEALAKCIRDGMPSSEEMRRNPPGAVGKHTAWQKRNAKAIQRYKHVALRLQAGGDLPARLKHSGDVANIELLRPLTTPNQLGMDGAQIPKSSDIHIGSDPANAVTFSDADLALLGAANPELAAQIAVLPAETRGAIKALLAKSQAKAASAKPAKAAKAERGDPVYNRAKALAKQHGIKVFGISKNALYAALRDAGLTIE